MRDASYEAEVEITRQLMDLVNHRWDEYLPMVIPEIMPAIEADGRRHVDCILFGHGGAKDMRITKRFRETGSVICTCTDGNPVRNGLDLIQRVRGVDFKTARDMLLDAVGGRTRFESLSNLPPPKPPVREVDPEELRIKQRQSAKVKSKIVSIWNDTLSLDHPDARPARLWFKRRGIWPVESPKMVQDLRFHRGLEFYEHEDGQIVNKGTFPALIAMVRNVDGRSLTINRTYITDLGQKAPFHEVRKLHEVPNDLTVTGGAVQLDEPTYCLNVAEGIETSLAVRIITGGMPTWSTLTKGLLENLVIPESVKIVTVWADKDRSDAGQSAAASLVLRLRNAGINAVAMLPPIDIPEGKKGVDWNDLIQMWGVKTIRQNHLYRQWLKAFHLAELKHGVNEGNVHETNASF